MLLNSFATWDSGTQARKTHSPQPKKLWSTSKQDLHHLHLKIAYLSTISVRKVSFEINEFLPFTVKLLLITCRRSRKQQQSLLSWFSRWSDVTPTCRMQCCSRIGFEMYCAKQRSVQWGSHPTSIVHLVKRVQFNHCYVTQLSSQDNQDFNYLSLQQVKISPLFE